MAKGVPEKHLRKTIKSILAAQSPKIRWGEALALFGLALGFGSWLYMVINPNPQFYLGLLLTLGCSGSFCGALWLLIPYRKPLKIPLCLALVVGSLAVYVKYGSP